MRYSLVFLLALNFTARAQALQDINYTFLYDPVEPFTLTIKPVRSSTEWKVYLNLIMRDSSQRTDQFHFQFELRTTLAEVQGKTIDPATIQKEISSNNLKGVVTIPLSATKQYLVIKILNNSVKRAWVFFKPLDPNYPVNGYLTSAGNVVYGDYIRLNDKVVLGGEGDSKIVSYYGDDFPAAVPAFSEGMGRVARALKVDTAFTVSSNEEISFSEAGLYLIQKDTSTADGYAFRVQNDYPRLAKVESLADPLIYVCTKQEFERVKAAKGDKKAFDRVILSITGNQERARDFIRYYFKRVEWANFYFTSYKEGWKTDRGMIYMLFGLPEELYRFNDREVWKYDSPSVKATFNFVRSSTLFDPDNYVLIREKKFQETWYEKIDLWRNARF